MTERKEDGGVFDATTGLWMVRVAANPRAGQYVFDGGRYTFAAADEGHARHFAGDPLPFKTLTAEEIAELRRRYGAVLKGSAAVDTADGYVTLIHPDAPKLTLDALRVLPRLLDEVEELRKHLDAVSGPRWREEKEAHERSRALLKRIEWMGSAYPDASDMPCCPGCDGQHKHEPGCELAALLKP